MSTLVVKTIALNEGGFGGWIWMLDKAPDLNFVHNQLWIVFINSSRSVIEEDNWRPHNYA